MGKELESIEQVTSSGELRNKLVEAEEAKVEIEAILLKRVSTIFSIIILELQFNSSFIHRIRLSLSVFFFILKFQIETNVI